MLILQASVITTGLLLVLVSAQTTLDASGCLPGSGISTFSACNYLYNQVSYCGSPAVPTGAPAVACYCDQQILNAIYDCESEQRLCFGNDELDSDAQREIDIWSSACDTKITFTPTTPILSSLTSTYNVGNCRVAASGCVTATNLNSQCSRSFLNTNSLSQFSSCTCQPLAISAEYSCLYLGNVSCKALPAALTNLPVYSQCVNGPSLLGALASTDTIPSSSPASTTTSSLPSSSMTSSIPSGVSSTPSVTRPALPGSTTTGPGSQSTASSTANIGSHISVPLQGGSILWIIVAGLVLAAVVV